MSKQVLIYSVVKQEKYSVTPEVHFFESTRVALKYSGKKNVNSSLSTYMKMLIYFNFI